MEVNSHRDFEYNEQRKKGKEVVKETKKYIVGILAEKRRKITMQIKKCSTESSRMQEQGISKPRLNKSEIKTAT